VPEVMTKRVHVAVGVIENARGEIFIAQRAAEAHQGGLWEFPGGKLEPGETTPQALARELREELAIEVHACRPLIQIRHEYPDKAVLLDVYRVTQFSGVPRGNEGQPVRWVAPAQLTEYEFPAANRPIIKAVELTEILPISGTFGSAAELARGLLSWSRQGITRGIVRAAEQQLADSTLIAQTLAVSRKLNLALQINCSPQAFTRWQAAAINSPLGLHLNSHQLRLHATRPIARDVLLGASCHSVEELELARQLEVDYALLSPVLATQSHPQAQPLGWDTLARWLEPIKFPVYALGGMTAAHLRQAQTRGAQGIAGIGAWWSVAGNS